ncbi:hypothetical protein [Pseudoxanthomonas wuyuanensis]|nr:hypothetical protein [Pseudoxanthomonas wuyuanensis]
MLHRDLHRSYKENRIEAPHFIFQTAAAQCAAAIRDHLQRRLSGTALE